MDNRQRPPVLLPRSEIGTNSVRGTRNTKARLKSAFTDLRWALFDSSV
jgi:hypothetical protein